MTRVGKRTRAEQRRPVEVGERPGCHRGSDHDSRIRRRAEDVVGQVQRRPRDGSAQTVRLEAFGSISPTVLPPCMPESRRAVRRLDVLGPLSGGAKSVPCATAQGDGTEDRQLRQEATTMRWRSRTRSVPGPWGPPESAGGYAFSGVSQWTQRPVAVAVSSQQFGQMTELARTSVPTSSLEACSRVGMCSRQYVPR